MLQNFPFHQRTVLNRVVQLLFVLLLAAMAVLAYLVQPREAGWKNRLVANSVSNTPVHELSGGEQGADLAYAFDWDQIYEHDWQKAIRRARNAPSVLNGTAALSLFRVSFRNVANARAVISGARLRQFELSGARRKLTVSGGEWIVYEHVPNRNRRGRQDLLTITTRTQGSAQVRIPVPAKGTVAILGDLRLTRNQGGKDKS